MRAHQTAYIHRIVLSFAAAVLVAAIGYRAPLIARAAPAAQAACTYQLNPGNDFIGPAATTQSISVSAPSGSGCVWTASSNASFLTITSGATGNGSGTVVYSATENVSTDPRSGTLTIAGHTFTVNQKAVCNYTFGASSIAAGIAGGTQSVTVTTGPSCRWSIRGSGSFLQFYDDASGTWVFTTAKTGSGTASVAVAANARGRRTAAITIEDQMNVLAHTITVQQEGKAVRSDFTGDGKSDLSVFRPASGAWIVQGMADSQLGAPGVIPVPGDYDGNGVVDKAVYRGWDAIWQIGSGAPIQFGQTGDLPVPADYDGDRTTDIAIFRTLQGFGQWTIRGQGGPFVLGQRGDIPVPEDYDGDGKADLAVFRPSNGTWYIATAASGFATTTTVQFGLGGYGDMPIPGDYDGDSKADVAVYRPGAFMYVFAKRSSDGSTSVFGNLGVAGDVAMALDTDGNGRDELVFFRPSTAGWTIRDPYGNPITASLGAIGDIPAAQRPRLPRVTTTDFDRDGASDMTVFRPSAGGWYTLASTRLFTPSATFSHTLGQSGDVKVPGDYDGDHKADFAVYRPSDGTWHIDFTFDSSMQSLTMQWGLPGDTPVPADYDGDGRTDIAVWRPSNGIWYILDSSTGSLTPRLIQWGLGYFDDVPVPGDFDGDGKADVAVYRPEPGLWYLKLSSGSEVVRQWGLGYYDDVPLVGDFDGDGRAEITVYRPAYGLWYSMDPLTGVTLPVRQFGLPGDVPLIEDFDADGITDLTVYRPSGGFWFTQRSTLGFYGPVQWGQSVDEPLLRLR